ncbi:MAG TPA: hypothetical protein VH186_23730 [Chloroflexia bacterium]|nr:hypothetical protein [Chloroflexia bacterium]
MKKLKMWCGLLVLSGLLVACGEEAPTTLSLNPTQPATTLAPTVQPNPTEHAPLPATAAAVTSTPPATPTPGATPVVTPVPLPTRQGTPGSGSNPGFNGTPPVKMVVGGPPANRTGTDCPPTPAIPDGPFYRPNAPQRSSVGIDYILMGTVRSTKGCALLPGAKLEIWLAGPDGQYSDDYRATLYADGNSIYRFESNYPPPTENRPPHIYVKASANGYKSQTAIYFLPKGETVGVLDLILIPDN